MRDPGATLGSPGAATSALTVGAVDKSDEAAWFSSRGPRVGDLAVKPEIVAPGAGIVAARAAGTTIGSVLDQHYTSLNGTSMATPHVAGAAAILAQKHPDWPAESLKARLVSTAHRLDQPVSHVGVERVQSAVVVGVGVHLVDVTVVVIVDRHGVDDVVEQCAHRASPRLEQLALFVGRLGHELPRAMPEVEAIMA